MGKGSEQQLGESLAACTRPSKGGDSWVPPTCKSLCQVSLFPV